MSSRLAINGGVPVRTKLFPAYRPIGEEEKGAVNRVMNSGVLSRYLGTWHEDFYGGPEVRAFENEWADFFGVKHTLAVNSNTSGLIAALGAIGIEPGDEVIVTPYSMCISATAPLWWGGIPVFADIEKDYFCLDPKSVESKITDKTKAILVVDLFGQPYDVDAINAIAKRHNLVVIEDAAQAPYAQYKNKFAGTLGDIGVFSLNYHKHIHTGEGGVIVTDNDAFAERVQLIRNHAEAVVGSKGVTDIVNMIGQNYRMTEIEAAIGREQLKKLPQLVEARIQNVKYLSKKLNQLPGIRVPEVRLGATHVYYVHASLFDESVVGVSRDVFIQAVRAELPATVLREGEGPLLSTGYVEPLYLLPLFQRRVAFGKAGYPFSLALDRAISYAKGICPVVGRLYEKELFTNEFIRPPATASDLDDVFLAFEKVYEHRKEISQVTVAK